MYCRQCGKELVETAVVCPNCGSPTANFDNAKKANKVEKGSYDKNGLKDVAKILMIICTVVSGFAIIPLAWCLPMTISYSRKVQNKEPISLGFKICILLFVSRIAGILLLVDDEIN